ncbi:MAG: FAD-binding protein [Candidatus Nezhaarchaeota archaeon]|nr:FAD-binding protein [Candidatus Nezhaarchaeota archaeon]MCX8141612.1 FAD-binding protein [Candidatus Nezhaarchaeota archaeon]MDW8049879.1 FAD-binding protein [Nitrososphaerota archaeon]
MSYETIETDVLIVGAGGAGLRAAIEAAKYNVDVTVVCKELLGKAHTVMAEGGINAALGNVDPNDNWMEHFLDTVEGGVWLNDQDLAEVLVKEAPDRIFDLEEWGAVFDRTPDGKIAQRPFGKSRHPRTVFVSDYTGHEIMTTLCDEVRRLGIRIMEEVFVSKLLTSSNTVTGAFAFDFKSGDFIVFRSKAIILATGGAGRMYERTTNPASATGDGKILALEAGAELMDMEMFQFHPTAMVWPPSCNGVLVTEGVRGEGGILLNVQGERFMKRYHELLELAPRDVVARAIWREIEEGRGTKHGGVYLTVAHLPPERIRERLKTMYKQFLLTGVDITKEPMEVAPAAHYYMGGVRANVRTETSVKGLFAAGEEMSGVHGANRLGGNSLLATQVFGKRAGENAAIFARENLKGSINKSQVELEMQKFSNLLKPNNDRLSIAEVRKRLCKVMWENAGIARTEEGLTKVENEIEWMKANMLPKIVPVESSTLHYNKEIVEILETFNLIRVAEILVKAARIRKESRGAHWRLDYPKRDDANWLKHITWYLDGGVLKYRFDPVIMTLIKQPTS